MSLFPQMRGKVYMKQSYQQPFLNPSFSPVISHRNNFLEFNFSWDNKILYSSIKYIRIIFASWNRWSLIFISFLSSMIYKYTGETFQKFTISSKKINSLTWAPNFADLCNHRNGLALSFALCYFIKDTRTMKTNC